MDVSTHQVRLARWKSVIEQCHSRPIGQTQREWLREHKISDKRFYYWQRIIRKEAYDQMTQRLPCQVSPQQTAVTFAEFTVPEAPPKAGTDFEQAFQSVSADAVVKTDRAAAVFSNTAPPDLVRSVMEVMLHA